MLNPVLPQSYYVALDKLVFQPYCVHAPPHPHLCLIAKGAASMAPQLRSKATVQEWVNDTKWLLECHGSFQMARGAQGIPRAIWKAPAPFDAILFSRLLMNLLLLPQTH